MHLCYCARVRSWSRHCPAELAVRLECWSTTALIYRLAETRAQNAEHSLHARGRVPDTAVAEGSPTDVGLRPRETAARQLRAGPARHRPRRDRNASRRGYALVPFRGRHRVRVQRHRNNHEARRDGPSERSESTVQVYRTVWHDEEKETFFLPPPPPFSFWHLTQHLLVLLVAIVFNRQ